MIVHALHEAGNLVYAKILLWIDYHDHGMTIINSLKLDIPHKLLRDKEDNNIALIVAKGQRKSMFEVNIHLNLELGFLITAKQSIQFVS